MTIAGSVLRGFSGGGGADIKPPAPLWFLPLPLFLPRPLPRPPRLEDAAAAALSSLLFNSSVKLQPLT